ncbi:MAG: hypothetical protein HW416_1667, partial [Chloroflexi bacterium]|nr:hypothetical protein [Chloroflexota bacterium]
PQIERAVTKYPYDLRATERFMAEAGYAKGADGNYTSPTEGRLSFEVLATGGPTADIESAIAAAGWRQAGFETLETAVPQGLLLDGQSRASFPGVATRATNANEGTQTAAYTAAQIARPENRWNGGNFGGWSSGRRWRES